MNSFEREPQLPLPLPLDDRTGPAPRIARDRAAAMIGAALVDFDRVPHATAARQRFAAGKMLAIAAGVLLALAGGAAAARYFFHFGEPGTAAPARTSLQPSAAPTAAAADVEVAEPVPEVAPVEELVEATPPLAAANRANRVLDRAAPEDLLQRANHMRADGQFRDAAHTYGLVYERFPRSTSAYVARAAAGAIELEHLSNPTRARRLFEQALREQPAGALDLEARQGLSVALRDLEDRPAEVRALQALVAAHPDSPAARRAQVRLRELGVSDR